MQVYSIKYSKYKSHANSSSSFHSNFPPTPLIVQQWRHLLAEILDNRIGSSLNLQAGGNGVQFDIGSDLPGRGVDLLSFFVGPHGGAELLRRLVDNIYTTVMVPNKRKCLTRTSGFNSVTVGRTSSITIIFLIRNCAQDKESHTGTVCLVDDDIPVLQRIGYSPDQTLGPFRGRVDSNKTERSFGGGHGEK